VRRRREIRFTRAEVHDVRFTGCTFSGNAGIGLYVHKALGVAVSDAAVENSVVEDNSQGIVMSGVEGVFISGNQVTSHVEKAKSGIALGEGTRRATVTGNRLERNFRGIIAAGASEVDIRGNTVVGGGPVAGGGEDADGIVCRGLRGILPDACVIASNEVRSVAGSGIVAQLVSGLRIEGNTVEASGQRGLLLRSAVRNEVRGNKVHGASRESANRFDGIELTQSADENQVTGNEVRETASMRSPIRVGADCQGNRLSDNLVTAAGRPPTQVAQVREEP
jgi:nitrous oxidase accessory protein NosD